jgi:hypothetical protein
VSDGRYSDGPTGGLAPTGQASEASCELDSGALLLAQPLQHSKGRRQEPGVGRPSAVMQDDEQMAVGGRPGTEMAVIDGKAAGRLLAAILAYLVAAADRISPKRSAT